MVRHAGSDARDRAAAQAIDLARRARETYSLPRDVVIVLKRAFVDLGYRAVDNPFATKEAASRLYKQIDKVLEKYRIKESSTPAQLWTRWQKVWDQGCSRCDVDEAEGGIVDHCNWCCREMAMIAIAAGLPDILKRRKGGRGG